MRRQMQILGVMAAVVLGMAAAYGADAAATAPGTPPTARATMEKFTGDVLRILKDGSLDKAARRQKVREVAYGGMDFETLAKLALGQYWKDLSPVQQGQFVEEFKKHLSATYGHTTDEYTDEDIKMTGDRKEANGDWTVMTKVIGTKNGARQEIAKVDYRLREKEGAWKVIDVTIDAVSLMANFRSQFKDVMASGGIEKLMKLLRDKNAAAEK